MFTLMASRVPSSTPGMDPDSTQEPNGYHGYRRTPLIYNNDGILYGDGSNSTLQFSSSIRLWKYFSGYVEPS